MPELQRPLLLGHRGARAVRSIPENTLESFDRALADGCDGFEFDVRLTADGQAVVRHDPRFGALDIARASAAQLPNLQRLEDVLSRYYARAFLDIELKVPGLEEITLDLLKKFPPRRGYVVSSFLPEVLDAIRTADTQIPLGLICETQAELTCWTELPVQYVIPHHNLAGPSLIAQLKKADRRVMVWTVNRPADMLHFRDLGVHAIISDDAGLLLRTIEGNKSRRS